ncbi:uncharacterized protein LOC108240305 isoform X2 [Kryptolebias marmoratus]|uniref:uncharacterized protein LOC108240305 isoform X2 n=1 Tax=Kryptolebias marmoratus TaxID=37003 RepID=UPI0007F8D3B4|nr:uncharacterized protein LOC108240305 isoform X2 [Kryptolebias marmoratus]
MFPLIWFILLLAVQEMLKSYKCDHQSDSLTFECKEEQEDKNPDFTLMICVSNCNDKSTKTVSLNFTSKITKKCVSSILDKINETLTNLPKTQKPKNVTNPTESPTTKKVTNPTVSQNTMSTENCINLTESQNTSVPFLTRIWEMVQKEPLLSLPFLGTGVLIGMLLSSIIACFVSKCHRKKSRNLDGLEMVTTETFSKKEEEEIQDFQDDGIQDQDGAEAGAESGGQLAAETNEPTEQNMYSSVNHTDVAPKETVYSNIDFSAMKERNPTDVEKKQDATETEYAEIKKGETKEGLDNNEDDSEMLGGSDEKEGKQSLLSEEVVGEDVPLYSSVDEIMEEN